MNASDSPTVTDSSIPVSVERRKRPRLGPFLSAYLSLKYRAFHKERRPRDGRRGVVALQIDALAHADLLRAIELGYCPTIAGLLRDQNFTVRKWFCGLPAATPYCQAGIFHGENDGIPAFRFYDKAARRVVTCNAPEGVQYIRDRIHSPGALAGGSSYVNLLDGDAATVAFTVATRERTSAFQRLGGGRLGTLMLLSPVRLMRIVVESIAEYLREEWERSAGELSRRVTHSEGIFPFIRILSNVVVRELQTMVINLDIYLGVPVIYSTFMQYDELGHHFGPSSRQALSDLKRTDRRIKEIWRTIQLAGGRRYDLVILSDHGMAPAISYRVAYGEPLGATVQRILDGDAIEIGGAPLQAHTSFADETEYADMGAQAIETVARMATPASPQRRVIRQVRDWMRRQYGLRDLLMPEKYRVGTRHQIVVTYSSSLALVYFADVEGRVQLPDILSDHRRAHLYRSLVAHPGIGLMGTLSAEGVHIESREGRARISGGQLTVLAGRNPLAPYGEEPALVRATEALVRQKNAGDLVLFGTFDGTDIICFDDQVGAHGAAGGQQLYPFLIAPRELELDDEVIENARDIHRVIMSRYAEDAAAPSGPSAASAS